MQGNYLDPNSILKESWPSTTKKEPRRLVFHILRGPLEATSLAGENTSCKPDLFRHCLKSDHFLPRCLLLSSYEG